MSTTEMVRCIFCGKYWVAGVGDYVEYSDGDVACSDGDACDARCAS